MRHPQLSDVHPGNGPKAWTTPTPNPNPYCLWLVVSTPLKNMKVSWDHYSQLNGNMKNVPSHCYCQAPSSLPPKLLVCWGSSPLPLPARHRHSLPPAVLLCWSPSPLPLPARHRRCRHWLRWVAPCHRWRARKWIPEDDGSWENHGKTRGNPQKLGPCSKPVKMYFFLMEVGRTDPNGRNLMLQIS